MKRILVVGSLNMDHVAKVDHIVREGETILATDFSKSPGGKGANQAYAIGKLGGQIAMLGAVGTDDDGNARIRSLHSVGVDTDGMMRCADAPTGTAWISVDRNGSNSITVIPGANMKVDTSYIDEHINAIESADIVIMQLEIPLETVVYTARLAKSMGKYVILDPAPAIPDLPEELYGYVDLLKPNETELSILAGVSADDTDYLKKVNILRQRGAADMLVSLGGDGVLMSLAGQEDRMIPSIRVEAVDTTAAGDSFVAGLAVKLAEDRDVFEAIDYAQKVAAIAVTRKGAQPSIPSPEEVK
ncbi:MAG: ribokinase [Clostridiales bacterium]|nr:ribokinase [Clostridiales bacterium]